MGLRRILQEGDETLRNVSKPVDKVTLRIQVLLDDMIETLKRADGAGLAAPQVGVLRRVAIADIGDNDEHKLIEMINPEIVESEGEVVDNEGCLSIPERNGYVPRPERVKVTMLNRKGERQTLEASGWGARVICHEIDHLNGILYIDKTVPKPEGIDEPKEKDA